MCTLGPRPVRIRTQRCKVQSIGWIEKFCEAKKGRANVKTKDLQSGWVIGLMLLNLVMPVAGAQSQSSSSALPNAPAVAAASVATPAPPATCFDRTLRLRPTDQNSSRWENRSFRIRSLRLRRRRSRPPRLTNSSRIDTLYRDGKIYLSLDDAILLALQNNFDIAIARYNLDIADTDLLRARSGQAYLGVNSGLVTNTIGGSTSPVASASPAATTGSTSATSFELRNHDSDRGSLRRWTRRNFRRRGWRDIRCPLESIGSTLGAGSVRYPNSNRWIRC